MARITIVTAGHLSTCPRMVKAADAIAEAGHEVRLVCTRFIGWASETDRELLAGRRWRARVVDFQRATAPVRSRYVAARRHLATALVARGGPDAAGWWTVTRAYGYVHPELVRAALEEPADLFYGGTTGALAAVAEAAARAGRPYGLDLEDLHTDESDEPDAAVQHGLARRVLARTLPDAAFVTSSSPLIGEAYRAQFGVRPVTIHNVFPLPRTPPDPNSGGPLRLYWFSQTIGPRRGIEDAIRAAGEADVEAVLTLRGRAMPAYVTTLRTLAGQVAPRLRLEVAPPIAPDRIPGDARQHHIGLSGESSTTESRLRCLENKIFTYLGAGLAVAMTATPAHTRFGRALGEAGCLYRAGEPGPLSAWLATLAADPARLAAARSAAWAAAVHRWHWEHGHERGALLELVERHVP